MKASNKEMKTLFLSCLLFLIHPLNHLIQAQIASNDENVILFNDYSHYPDNFWLGETIRFQPEDTPHGTFLRQKGDPQAGSHTIYTNSSVYFGSWDFSVMFDGFTTSNQNRVWVWLTADDNEHPQGYAVRIGESGSMKYARLFRLRGLEPPVELLRSNRILPDDNLPFNVRVERTIGGIWRLGVKTTYDSNYQWSETEDHASPFFAPFFGFQTNFTATRADRFLFGPVRIEREPLGIRRVHAHTSEIIEIELNDRLPEPFSVFPKVEIRQTEGYQAEIKTMRVSNFSVIIELESPLRGGTYILDTGPFTDYRTGAQQPAQRHELLIFDDPAFGDVVISEVAPRALEGTTPQFVELYNTSTKLFNLDTWSIRRGSQSVPLPPQILHPGEFVVVSRNTVYTTGNSNNRFITAPLPSFSVNQDQIWLTDPEGNMVDSIAYTSKVTSKLSDGQSLERIDPRYPGSDSNNWNPHPEGHHSAGKHNLSYTLGLPDLTLLNARLTRQNTVIIDFNMIPDLNDATTFSINSTPVNSVTWSISNGKQIQLDELPEKDWINNSPGILQITDITRFGDSSHVHFQIEVAQPVYKQGDILINELLYQPIQNRFSAFSDQSEFIEIYNTRTYSLDLSDVFIADTPDKHKQYRSWNPENPYLWRVHGNGYAVLHADTARYWENSRMARFFQIPGGSHMSRANRSTLGLTSTGRGVYLRTADVVIDSVYYNPAWHHPYIHDPRGRSLERVSTDLTVAALWSTSASVLGGTPGERNSISQDGIPSADEPSKMGLRIYPNPFSPDMDGQSDVVEINLTSHHPGYLASIFIFNRHGRMVRTLVRDEYIGNTFSVHWNGIDDRGRLLPTGVYIVHVELNQHGRPVHSYTEPLVLARSK
ncbi:MAG: lamin tail domain-containing protein [Bacteroidetes bacterium]|nr:lamin tail domain-containing protein [Bacteroidota bacterium]